MRKRRPLGCETNITKDAAVIWRAAFHQEPFPEGWRVIKTSQLTWGDIGRNSRSRAGRYLGYCSRWNKTVYLTNRAWHEDGRWNRGGSRWLGVLIHEFIHLRCRLPHGVEFNRLADAAYDRVWE